MAFNLYGKIIVISVLICLHASYMHSQNLEAALAPGKNGRGLQLGDRVPDIPFKMINQKKHIIKLSDFKGKLVILDFWATWCGTCIHAFPKIDSLQSVFKNQLKVLLVNSVEGTWDTRDKVERFLKKRKEKGHPLELGTAIEDSIAYKLFVHRSLPHYVWISPEGIVQAITGSEEVNYENIKKILTGERNVMVAKRDFYADQLFNLGEVQVDSSTRYFYFKKGWLPGVPTLRNSRRLMVGNDEIQVGVAMYNVPLMDIFQSSIFTQNDDLASSYNRKKIIVEVDDSSDLFFDPSRHARDAWEKEHLYTFDVVVQPSEVPDLRKLIFDYLNIATNYRCRIEKRKVKCLAIVAASNPTKGNLEKSDTIRNRNSSEMLFHNQPVGEVINLLNNRDNSLLMIFDDTKNAFISLKVDLDNPDLSQIRRQLNKQGFNLIEEMREMEMFVLSDKKKVK